MNNGPLIREIKTWRDFVSLVEKAAVGKIWPPSYLYRGQARADWDTLQPSFLRLGVTLQASAATEIEKTIVDRFRRQALTHLPSVVVPDSGSSPLNWWCLMQHYRVPTRLLDWTRSWYVAAYFAVESEPNFDGAVWIVRPHAIRDAMTAAFPRRVALDHLQPDEFWNPNADHDLEFIAPPRETDRMTAQQTAFSISRWILADHGEIIAEAAQQKTTVPEGQEADVQFCKLVIPRQQKLNFLRNLAEMNITASSLFPGLDGVGRAMTELMKLLV